MTDHHHHLESSLSHLYQPDPSSLLSTGGIVSVPSNAAMTTSTFTSSSSSAWNHPSSSILSEKVSRALQVRTDTPAMKAALDALSNLQQPSAMLGTATAVTTTAMAATSDGSNPTSTPSASSNAAGTNSSSSHVLVDSRSVRVAIEQDALQQALVLQKELQSLVDIVQELRKGVIEATENAHRVRNAIYTNVITTETKHPMLNSTTGNTDSNVSDMSNNNNTPILDNSAGVTDVQVQQRPLLDNTGGDDTFNSNNSNSKNNTTTINTLEEEQKLATLLYTAFRNRDISKRRLHAVHEFLEQFDLSQEDSRLLDHYAFEDITNETMTMHHPHHHHNNTPNTMDHFVNGLAFLNALERVRKMRLALGQTFGNTNELAMLQQRHSIMGSSVDDENSINSTQDHHHRGLGASSALRMMENLAQKQERSYERLYHWLQKYLRLLGNSSSGTDLSNESDHDILDEALQHPFVKRALYTLRSVPAFYTHTLEMVAASRRSEETRRFLLALTSGFGGLPPIEMKAHDSVAYVGDMLSFAFKAFSMEADVAKGLVEYKPQEEKVDEETEQKDEATDRDDVTDGLDGSLAELSIEKPITGQAMLNISMSGLSRPLKSRILHVIATLARRPGEDDAQSDDGMNQDFEDEGNAMRNRVTQTYDICGLLLFYIAAIEKGVRKLSLSSPSTYEESKTEERNPLILALVDCLMEATKAYEATTRVYGTMLDQVSESTGESEVSQAHSLLASIVDVRLHSPGFSAGIECPSDCREILSIEWITETVVSAAAGMSRNLDHVMALKQSVNLARSAGISVIAASKLDEIIERKEADLMDDLVDRETKRVLEICGLAPLVDSWKQWDNVTETDTLMCSQPGLAIQEVQFGMKEFYASLYSPPLPSLETVVDDPHLRKTIRSKIARNVCDLYFDLYKSITSVTRGGYEDVSFLGHSPDQVRTLFSV